MDRVQLFLSTADPHRGNNFINFEQLRARIHFWSLLVDEIVITDAIRNNNATIRSLLAPDLYPPSGWSPRLCEPSVRALFEKEVLVVAERKGGTAVKLLHSQANSPGAGEVDLPTMSYCSFVDATIGKRIYFEGQEVAGLFRENLISNLDRSIRNPRERGIPKSVSLWFKERVADSASVNLRELRDIGKNPLSYGIRKSVATDLQYAWSRLSALFDDSYRANVAMALNMKSEFYYPEDWSILRSIQLGDNFREDQPSKEKMRPSFILNPAALNSVPSHVFLHIRSLEISQKARTLIARAFGGGPLQVDEAVAILSEYFAKVEDEIIRSSPDAKRLAALQNEQSRGQYWNVDVGIASAGVSALGFWWPVEAFICGLVLVAFGVKLGLSGNRSFQRKASRLRNIVGTPRPLLLR